MRASAPAACAPSSGSNSRLSDSAYLGLGFLVAGLAATVQFLGWQRYGARRATQGPPEDRRLALRRWVVFTVAWQVVVLAGVAAYIAVEVAAGHPKGAFWAVPAVGAVVGTALPLQFVVAGLLKTLR